MNGATSAGWWHIARRDLRAAATAPLLWLVLGCWLLLVHGVFALSLEAVHGRAALVPLYTDALWSGGLLLVLFAPAMTMNAWAAERAQGTWQLLLTLPVRDRDLVLGKFAAGWALLLILIGATVAMLAVLAAFSGVAGPQAAAGYLGLVLLAALAAALGTWIGLAVDGPVAAYVLGFAGLAVLWLAGVGGAEGPLGPLAAAIGLGPRFSPFIAGRLALADALWFVGATALFLVLAGGAVRAARSGGSGWRRAGAAGGPAAAVLLLAILAVAAGQRAGAALDLSSDRRFSLDPALQRRLAAMPGDTAITAVWDDADDALLAPIADACRVMAQQRGVSFRRLDPVRNRPLLDELRARHGEPAPPALWIEHAGRGQRLALHERSRPTLQRDVAGALIALADPSPPVVLVLHGHGELAPAAADAANRCGQLFAAWRAAGLVPSLVADGAPAPPPDAVLALLGPTAPLGDAVLARLGAHLRDGGGLLVLADDRAPADLGAWLRRRGLLHGAGVPAELAQGLASPALLDPAAPRQPPAHLVSLAQHWSGAERELPHHNLLLAGGQLNPRSPLTQPLADAGRQVLSPYTAGVEALPHAVVAGLGVPPFTAEPLLSTLRGDAWLRVRGEPLAVPAGLEQADARRLAWALSYQPDAESAAGGRGARLLVWGSRQAGSDAVLEQGSFANAELLAGACRWLARRDPPPEVPAAELRAFRLDLSDAGLRLVQVILAIIMPMACLGLAMLMWFDRRR